MCGRRPYVNRIPSRFAFNASAAKTNKQETANLRSNMYRTPPKVERKILTVVSVILLVATGMFINKERSVHVASLKRRKEDNGAVVFEIEIVNPTDSALEVFVRLAMGDIYSRHAIPAGIIRQEFSVFVPAGEAINFEKRYKQPDARFLGGSQSAHVIKVVACSDAAVVCR